MKLFYGQLNMSNFKNEKMKKAKLLIVDDHKMIREGLRMLLGSEKNIEIVSEASNGAEAIKFLENNPDSVNVILMDITMPELNGVDATEIITKLHPEIKVLALTMHAEETYILKMIKAGAKGYVLKDSSQEILIDAINTVLNGDKFYSNEVSVKLINALIFNKDVTNNKFGLSTRELQILKYVTKGKTNSDIGTYLDLSRRTIEAHRNNILKKIGVSNTAELIVTAVKNGLA